MKDKAKTLSKYVMSLVEKIQRIVPDKIDAKIVIVNEFAKYKYRKNILYFIPLLFCRICLNVRCKTLSQIVSV